MSIAWNGIANYVGQGIAALLAIVFIPIYVRKLGAEGYGLIGFYSSLYALLGIIDSSMQALLSRSAAQFLAKKDLCSLANRVRTLEILLGGVGMIVIVASFSIADIASRGVRLTGLTPDHVAVALRMIGLVLALRLFEGIYRACLVGMERQILFNGIYIFLQSIRWGGGAVVVTFVSGSVEAFFLWQAIAAGVSVVMLGSAAYRSIGKMSHAVFEWDSLWRERRFVLGMVVISGMAVLLTQADKLLLVKIITLAEYGEYALAATAAGALMLLIGPIADAIYPRLVQAWTKNDVVSFAEHFHLGARWVTVTVGSVACTGMVFAPWILTIWIDDTDLGRRITPLFQVLLFGNLLNALMWIPYRAQLASGWTSLAARINVVAVICLVPLIVLITPVYGAQGAAWVWVALNAGYVLIGMHFMFKRLLVNEKMRWYWVDVVKPIAAALIAVVVIALAAEEVHVVFIQIAVMLLALAIALLSSLAISGKLKL